MPEYEKISASQFKEAASLSDNEEFELLEWRGITIRVKKCLTLYDMMAFTDYVVKACFDSETGEYLPEMRDFAIDSAIINFYTNIELPSDPAEQFKLLSNISLPHIIVDAVEINKWQYHSLLEAIEDKIESLVSADVYELKEKFEDAMESLASVTEQMSNIFGDFTGENISGILESLSANGFDEEKFARAFISQYINGNKAPEIGASDNDK